MELPIQIMIVLFVSILVGSSVILFSTDLINDAREAMARPTNDEKEDLIIELREINEQGLKILMEDCFEKNKQDALSKTLCYVVHSEDEIGQLDPEVEFETIIDDIPDNTRTLYVYYNPQGNMIEVKV